MADQPANAAPSSSERQGGGISDVLVSIILFLLALIPRTNAVWQGFITPDEPSWVFRSVRFMQALEARHWVDTLQIGHPGVVTMWMGTLGLWWQRWRDASATAVHLSWIDNVAWVTPDNGALFRQLAALLPPSRIAMALLNTLGIVGIYVLSMRLWDRRLALVGAVLIAFDPFAIGLSGLLHVDAPAMTWMTLSLLAWLVTLKRERSPDSGWTGNSAYGIVSGFCAGLGILSKSPAIFIVIASGVSALLFFLLAAPPSWRRLGRIALLALLWGLGAVAALFALFPAMWTDPADVLQRIYGLADRHLDMPHRITFFRGIAGSNPGPWFYPTVLLFRLTPITLVGVVLSVLPLVLGSRTAASRSSKMSADQVTLASLWAFAIGFTAFVTIGAKKFDRYLLPVFPTLNILAAAGWMSAIRLLHARLRRKGGTRIPAEPFAVVLVSFLLAQLTMIVPGWPYYLDAYNPLVGGMGAALRTLPVGWGEGLEQMARYLNVQPNAADRIVAGASPVTLGPLFRGKTLILDESSRLLADDVLITALDRQIYPERVATMISGAHLAHTVRVGGHEVLWLYNTQHHAEAEHLAQYAAPEDVVLCDAPSPFARHTPKVQLLPDADQHQLVDLLNRWSASHTRLWYLAYPMASPITASYIRWQLDTYAVQLNQADLGYATATLYILPETPTFKAVAPETEGHLIESANFGGEVALVGGMLLEQSVATSSTVRFRLRWRATATPHADFAPFIHLLDEAGHLRNAGRGEELLVDERYWATFSWQPGDGVELDYQMGLPPGLPPGRYRIVMGLSDAQSGGWVPVLDQRGSMVGTTSKAFAIDVLRAAELPDPNSLQLANPDNVTFGRQITLLGYEHPSKASVGETIVVELAWLGQDTFDGDYSVRISLASTGGEIPYSQTFPLSTYPTSLWRVGELLHDLYDLKLPATLQGDRYTLTAEVLDSHGVPLAPPTPLGRITISVESRLFELPHPPQHPLAVRLGENISLLGYDLPQSTVGPGGMLSLTLYWRCESPIETSYTVFVHLLNSGGQTRGQQDLIPVGGRAPTSGWVNGQIVIDEYAVPVSEQAQPGTYALEVGMYNAQDMVRVPVWDGEGNRIPGDQVLLDAAIVISGK